MTLNSIAIEGLFQHTARASLPRIILLQDLFFQLFQFLIFVRRFVFNLPFPYALITFSVWVIPLILLLLFFNINCFSMCLPRSCIQIHDKLILVFLANIICVKWKFFIIAAGILIHEYMIIILRRLLRCLDLRSFTLFLIFTFFIL